MKKMSLRVRLRIILGVLIALAIALGFSLVYREFSNGGKPNPNNGPALITKAPYTLIENATDLMVVYTKTLNTSLDDYFQRSLDKFEELAYPKKREGIIDEEGNVTWKEYDLSLANIDNDIYLEAFSKAFVINMFNWTDKENRKDLEFTLQFIHPEDRDNVFTYLSNTYYKYLDELVIEYGRENLAEITRVKLTKVEETTYENKVNEQAFTVEGTIEFKDNEIMPESSMPSTFAITIIKKDQFLFVVSMATE